MVVAGSDSPPYAYMVLAEDILGNIATCSPETIKVSLPQRTKISDEQSRPNVQRLVGVEREELAETSSLNLDHINFEVSKTVDIPMRNMREVTKTATTTTEIYVHGPRWQRGKIRALFPQLFCGLGSKEREQENTSNAPRPRTQAHRVKSKQVRHYPRSPARSRKEVAAASRRSPG
jgi:hypothetical protein